MATRKTPVTLTATRIDGRGVQCGDCLSPYHSVLSVEHNSDGTATRTRQCECGNVYKTIEMSLKEWVDSTELRQRLRELADSL